MDCICVTEVIFIIIPTRLKSSARKQALTIGRRKGHHRIQGAYDAEWHACCFSGADRVANGPVFVRGGTRICSTQARKSSPLIGLPARRRGDRVMALCGEKRQRFPVAMRDFGDERLAASAPAARAGHVGFCPVFIDENKAGWTKSRLIFLPVQPVPGDVGDGPARLRTRFF